MAKKRSRASAVQAGGGAPAGSARSATQPTREDLDLAREEALLQLRIGRSAHYYSVAVSVALLVDAFLVLYLTPSIRSIGPVAIHDLFPLLFPLAAGVYLSFTAVQLKWQAYQFSVREPHFLATLGAAALNAFLLLLVLARVFGYGPTASWQLIPGLYPLVLLGIGAPLISLALVWTGWSNRKVASVIAAIVPVPLSLALYLPAASQNPLASANALATTLFVSAALFQTSGSFLHLISSGTEPHRREVIQSGQGRIYALAEELQRKEDAVRFREQSLIRREADAESAEVTLADHTRSLEESRAQLETFEQNLRTRATEIAQKEQQTRATGAQLETLRHSLDDRETGLKLREQEVAARNTRFGDREKSLIDREGAIARRELDSKSREGELGHRNEEVKGLEARMTARQQQIEQKTVELLRREGEIKAREGVTTVVSADRSGLAKQSQELARRETELAQLKSRLDEQNLALGRKARQADASVQELERARKEVAQRDQQVTAREATLKQREGDAAQKVEAAQLRQSQYEEVARKMAARLKELQAREGQLGSRAGEADRIGQVLSARETSVKEKEMQVAQRRNEVALRERDLLERERAVEARESEVSLKSIALERRPAVVAAAPGRGEAEFTELLRGLEFREKQLREKEQQFLKRQYEAQKEPAPGDTTLSAAPSRRIADRLTTGTPRLDDLLLGGFVPKAHVLVVGPPFSGKEMLLYSFVAEGLKRGEPALLVTTSRSPEEVAQEIGKVTPQFREFEQLGLVSWIDASNPAATPSVRDGEAVRAVVKGPGDHPAILTALVKAAQKAESAKSHAFRVGFLGLSSSLGQSDEREAFNFLQNFVGILKQRNALAVYVVEQGTLPDGRVESIQGRMDGAIKFKQERGKGFLSVQGLGDVQTRDWVEYRATNRQLVIGSFALERIR